MSVELVRLPQSQVQLDCTVEPARVQAAIEKAFSQIARDASMPGFRKGKVPRAILERSIDRMALLQEASEICVNEAYREALTQFNLHPLVDAEVELPDATEQGVASDGSLRFIARVFVRPEVTLPDYSAMSVSVESPTVTPAQIDETLERLRQERTPWETIADAASVDGDQAVLALHVRVDDEEYVNQERMEYILRADEAANLPIPLLSFHLIGHKAGDLVVYDVTLPETYRPEDMVGKAMHVAATVLEVHRKALPALNDEFAQTVGDFATVDDLRKAVEQSLFMTAAQNLYDQRVDRVLSMVVSQSELDVAPVLVDHEIDEMVSELRREVEQGRYMTLDQYLSIMGKDMDALREEMRPSAEQRARSNAVLDAVAKQASLTAAKAEVDEEILTMSRTPLLKSTDRRRILSSSALRDRVQQRLNRRSAMMHLLGTISKPAIPAGDAAADAAEIDPARSASAADPDADTIDVVTSAQEG